MIKVHLIKRDLLSMRAYERVGPELLLLGRGHPCQTHLMTASSMISQSSLAFGGRGGEGAGEEGSSSTATLAGSSLRRGYDDSIGSTSQTGCAIEDARDSYSSQAALTEPSSNTGSV